MHKISSFSSGVMSSDVCLHHDKKNEHSENLTSEKQLLQHYISVKGHLYTVGRIYYKWNIKACIHIHVSYEMSLLIAMTACCIANISY